MNNHDIPIDNPPACMKACTISQCLGWSFNIKMNKCFFLFDYNYAMLKIHKDLSKSLKLVFNPSAQCVAKEYECFEVGVKYEPDSQANQSVMLDNDVSHPEGAAGCQGQCKLQNGRYKYWTWDAANKKCGCIKTRAERISDYTSISGSVKNCDELAVD
jgi:hypothetical protein